MIELTTPSLKGWQLALKRVTDLIGSAVGLVLAAPVMQITPLMGANLLNIVFAVVVIGGLGSIAGAALTGIGLGLVEGLTKTFYPEASTVVVNELVTGP